MFTTLRIVSLGAAVMLAAPGTGVAESGGFLKVPQEVWTNINRFVFLAALDANAAPGNPEYQRRIVLPSWPEVYAAGKQWSDETFPALEQLAAELAADDIGARLQTMVLTAQSGDRGRFDTAATAVETRLAALLARSTTIKGKIDRLAAAGRTMRRESQQLPAPDLALHAIEIKAEQAGEALRAATFAWTGLQSDVTELRRVVGKAQGVDPEWYARIGIKRWADVVGDAKAFLADMKTQQRYLTGEDYYDNCGIEPEASVVLGVIGRRPEGWGQYIGSRAAIRWQFSKLGKGWWRLRVKEIVGQHVLGGIEKALDAGKAGAALVATTGPLSSGQFWRAIPAGNGVCSLHNSFEGAGYSLTYALEGQTQPNPSSFPMKLMPTTGAWAQQWSIDCTWRSYPNTFVGLC